MEKINEFKISMEKGQLIGVDIGLSAVKLCLLSSPKKHVYRLDKYISIPLSEATIIEDEIQKPDEVISAIQDGLRKMNPQKNIACLGMDGPNTVTKRLQVPDGVQEEVEDNILWESEQYIPFGADDAEIGFSVLGRIEEEDIVDAIVGAVKTDVVEGYLDYLKEAGLTARVVDMNVFATVNMFELIVDNKLDKVSNEGAIIFDFGAQYTTIIVYKNNGPVLTKEINLGGVLITEEIQRNLGISYEEAEDLKINGDENGNLLEDVLGIIELHIGKIIEELKKVLNFYIAAGSSEQVGSCYMTGGGSNLPGIKEALESLIDLQVEVLNPFEAIEIKGKFSDEEIEEIASCGLVAMGLGLRSV
jgi:type IV pilus assembly protein PilM